jgi:hypothetical protein
MHLKSDGHGHALSEHLLDMYLHESTTQFIPIPLPPTLLHGFSRIHIFNTGKSRTTRTEMERRRRWIWLWEEIQEEELELLARRRLAWGLDGPESDVAAFFSRELCESCKKIPIGQLLRSSTRNDIPPDYDPQLGGNAENREPVPLYFNLSD